MNKFTTKNLNSSIKRLNQNAKEVDTREIGLLLNNLGSGNTDINDYPEGLKYLRVHLDGIIKNFRTSYKELVSYEITISNLNIAADSILERNMLVEDIQNIVEKDRVQAY